jgi:D-sedoheptulose 7-phosphate isomerase
LGRKGDVLVGISTSGKSGNVVKAFEAAKDIGITTIAFTGEDPKTMGAIAEHVVAVPAQRTDEIQQLHIIAGHLICGCVEKRLFG